MLSLKPPPDCGKSRALLAGFVLVAALAVPLTYGVERTSLRSWARKTERFMPKTSQRHEFDFAGLATPATQPALKATLSDDEKVIGIEAGGKSRAYHQRSMSGTRRHIVNDLLGGKAVTVTYCDIDDCARAFGGAGHSTPLDVSQAGLLDGRMLVKVGNVAYFQASAEVAEPSSGHPAVRFPYPPFPLIRTTWGEWKSRHPDTDVFVHHSQIRPEKTSVP